ncbi:MAG: hypothetical protein RMK01_12025 [Thermomicrobium sp.]|nr:hypothetical protein [Thermomicrobium sp.]
MLPAWLLSANAVVSWLVLLLLATVVVRLAARVQEVRRYPAALVESERERSQLGVPAPPLVLQGPGTMVVLGQEGAAPAVVLALDGRCPPCAAFAERLAALAGWCRVRGIQLVVATPEPDRRFAAAEDVLTVDGRGALHALGVQGFPTAVLVDEEGLVSSRVTLRSVDDRLETVSLVLLRSTGSAVSP